MEILAGSGYIVGMDKHPKRPRDPSQLAKMMIDIASGEHEEAVAPKPSRKAEGGKKKASLLTEEERKELAKHAAQTRWAKS